MSGRYHDDMDDTREEQVCTTENEMLIVVASEDFANILFASEQIEDEIKYLKTTDPWDLSMKDLETEVPEPKIYVWRGKVTVTRYPAKNNTWEPSWKYEGDWRIAYPEDLLEADLITLNEPDI